MSAVIRTVELSMQFRNTMALNNLSLEAPEGSVFALLGPNGAGKTTTIKILMNILRPSSGCAEVLGRDSQELGPADFERIGYVSENQEMPDWMTIGCLFRYLEPFYSSWDRNRATELIRNFRLPIDRKLRHLSRGMWMKTALASSLAYGPSLLVLDEPFSGLDPLVRDDLIGGILDTAGDTTILISSHDLAEIENIATHVGFIAEGRLVFSEEMTSLKERFREVEITVDPPAYLPIGGRWPSQWLRPETSAAVVRFVDTSFDQERTISKARQLFGTVRHFSATPMPLRSIFLTLVRSAEL